MKHRFLIAAMAMIFAVCSINKLAGQVPTKISADSLIVRIDKYRNTEVEVEGLIIYVCSFNGKKLKLETKNGEIIKIVPKDTLASFDTTFYKRSVKVKGIVKESRLDKAYIDKMEKERTLLCHIDNTPCKDSAWVSRQVAAGRADRLSKRDIDKLRAIMKKKNKDYVSVVSIIAEKCEIIR
ncbi:MAG: hypothetical protein HOO91_20795 [Bacteroidales bacterium]|nr:hypothetical protein [Bacteroidales bacterium]